MGCGGSAENLEFDLTWNATDLGDFVLECDEHKILRIFDNQASRPKSELIDILHNSLFYYLVKKNHENEYPKKKEYAIQRSMEAQGIRKNHKLRDELMPLCKWMSENKLSRNQTKIEADNYAETVGKWFDEYTNTMSSL